MPQNSVIRYPLFLFLPLSANDEYKTTQDECNRRHVARHDTTVVHFLTSSIVSGSEALTKFRKLKVAIHTTEQRAIAGES